MNVDECFSLRLLIKTIQDLEKSKSDLKTAETKLERAKKLYDSEFFSEVIINAYTCMFHSARALLYRDGIQEKSHYAVYIYLDEIYSKKINKSLLNSFYNYQRERHNILYGFNYEARKLDAENILIDAEDFLANIKKILNFIK